MPILNDKPPKILADLTQSSSLILITEHGKKTAYLLSVDAFEKLQKRMEILESIARGERAVQEGRVMTHFQALGTG